MSAGKSPFRQMGSDRIDPVLVVLWVVLIVLAIIWVAPAVFIVSTSLKSTQEVMGGSAFAPPTEVYWQNYESAWERGRFSTTFLNSVIVTFVKVPIGLAFSAMAAYALSRVKLSASKPILALFVFGTMLPFQVMLAPLFSVVNGIGAINTFVGLWLPYIAFGVPYQVFILHGFFKEVDRKSVV